MRNGIEPRSDAGRSGLVSTDWAKSAFITSICTTVFRQPAAPGCRKRVLHQLQQNKGRRLEPVLELLHQQDTAVRGVYHNLVRIHRYYECMVNVSPLEASAEMCALARRTLQTLKRG